MQTIISFVLSMSLLSSSATDVELKKTDLTIAKQEISIEKIVTKPVFNPDDITIPCGLSEDELEIMLRKSLSGLAKSFLKAEEEYGINAIFLASLAAEESGWGESNYAQTRNNLFGFAAYTSNSDNAKRFKSFHESIMKAAQVLKKDYLTEGASYYRGTSVSDIHKTWAANPKWSNNIISIARGGVRRISEKSQP